MAESKRTVWSSNRNRGWRWQSWCCKKSRTTGMSKSAVKCRGKQIWRMLLCATPGMNRDRSTTVPLKTPLYGAVDANFDFFLYLAFYRGRTAVCRAALWGPESRGWRHIRSVAVAKRPERLPPASRRGLMPGRTAVCRVALRGLNRGDGGISGRWQWQKRPERLPPASRRGRMPGRAGDAECRDEPEVLNAEPGRRGQTVLRLPESQGEDGFV